VPKIKLLVISHPDPEMMSELQQLQDSCETLVSDNESELRKWIPAAQVVLYRGVSGRSLSLSDLWQQAKAVRWVHSLSAGVEHLLSSGLSSSDVQLTNARGVFKRSLAEFAVLGILFHYKRVRRLIDNQRQHKWDRISVKFADGRVMGIVGYGEIGRECALLAKGLGLKIHGLRRNPERSTQDPLLDRVFGTQELNEMLRNIDILLCAAPLTPQTHHMISSAQFAVMKTSAIVINVGRGAVIDEAALISALQSERIAGASLDVFEEEPLPPGSPLWAMENVLVSAHSTDETEDPSPLELGMRLFVENLRRYREGQPLLNVVDKQAGY
jgi:phosphoglycerate dehydrogenase-like enzyme